MIWYDLGAKGSNTSAYPGSVLFLTQWWVSSPKNCTPSKLYSDIKNKKNRVTL